MDSCPAQKEVKASQLLTKHQQLGSVACFFFVGSHKFFGTFCLTAWPWYSSSRFCWMLLLKKKRAPPFFNFVFSSLLLCDVPWWCYTIVVWTQDNSWCYLVYFVGVALWCLHKNPFSGYFLVFIWIKKYDVLCTIHTMILPMHGGLLICKKTKWRFFTKEFLWLSLYTSIRIKQKAWNICEEAYIC